jgi:WD40 repeat protein
VASGQEIARRDRTLVSSFAFTRDGKRLVTSGSQTVIWNIASRTVTRVIGLQPGTPDRDDGPSAVLTADGTRVLVAAGHGASLWDLATGAKIVDFCCHAGKTYSAVFDSNGERVISTAADRTALAWRAFPTIQDLVDYARSVVPRGLTPEQLRALRFSRLA